MAIGCWTRSWFCIGTAPGCVCGWLRTFCWNLYAGLGGWPCIAPRPRTCCPWAIPPTRWPGPPAPGCCCWPGTPLGGTWRMPLALGTCPPPGICIPEGRICCCCCIGCQRGRICCIWGVKNGRWLAWEGQETSLFNTMKPLLTLA